MNVSRALCVIILLCMVLCVIPAGDAFAVEALVGAKVWYVAWNPYLKDVGEKIAPWEGWQYIEGGSGMMYGPSASLLLSDRLTFSVSYLYGVLGARYDANFIESNGDTNLKVEYHFTGYARTVRHDLDTALSYSLSQNFKLFAGFKYQPLMMKVNKQGGFWDLNDATGRKGSGRVRTISTTTR